MQIININVLGDSLRFYFSNDGFLCSPEWASFHDYAGKKQRAIIHRNGISRMLLFPRADFVKLSILSRHGSSIFCFSSVCLIIGKSC